MAHPIANIALSLAPMAADMVGKILNLKKEANEKSDLDERVEKLENYEVEQAKLMEELSLKVDYLYRKNRTLSWIVSIALWFAVLSLAGLISFFIVT